MANKKIYADLTAAASVVAADVIPVVTDTGGTPTTKRATLQKLLDLMWASNTGLTASRAVVLSAGGVLNASATTATQLALLSTATDLATAAQLMLRDSNADVRTRMFISGSIAGGMCFQGLQNNTKPIFGSDAGSTNGLWNTTDGVWELRGGGGGRLLASGSNLDYNGRFRQTPPNGFSDPVLYAQGFAFDTVTTQVGNTAATLTDLYTKDIGSGNFTPNKTGYRLRCWGTFAATASVDKQLKLVAVGSGTTTLIDTGAVAVITAVTWSFELEVIRTGTGTAKWMATYQSGDPVNSPPIIKSGTISETLANALTIKVQGTGTNASDVLKEAGKVMYDAD